MKIGLVASGDMRESANIACWPAQLDMETKLAAAVQRFGHQLVRQHRTKPSGHGFIAGQREGMQIFADIDPTMPLIVAEAVWQYSHHVLAGLKKHRGPILTVANWSGQWPGLVGLLNLNGSLAKAGVPYSTLWSENFEDSYFLQRLDVWLDTGSVTHDLSHVIPVVDPALSDEDHALVQDIVTKIQRDQVILGVFDEGCMGMYNAIIPDELLMDIGVYKERLSQSALFHATQQVPDDQAEAIFNWLTKRGLKFHFGRDGASDLTKDQVVDQCRMYIAAVRMADDFGCDAIGIQYQQGLKDLLPASDLVEGMLNNADRPPVRREDGTEIRANQPVIHFNEVDECAGLDAILINQIHTAIGQPVETTLHDLRWGDITQVGGRDEFVWVFEISGAAPPAHNEGGWAGSESFRQPAMYFPSGGGTLKGYAKAGQIIWSRIFVEDGQLQMDIGRGEAVTLSADEADRRSRATTYEWPIMHGVLHGVSRDQMMARHKANHIQVVYATDAYEADRAMAMRIALAQSLGIACFRVGSHYLP